MSEKIAVVLSGGGSKGAFQVGALKRLYEAGIRPQIVCGTSVGALNGAKLAEGTPTVVDELESLWLSVRGNSDVLAWSPPIVDFFNALGKLAQSNVSSLDDVSGLQGALEQALVRRLGLLVGTTVIAPGFLGALFQVVQLLGLRKRIVDVVDALGEALNGESLFVTNPLLAKINQYLDVSKVRSSGIELRITGVDFQTSELVLMNQNHPNLVEAVLSSAVQPVFMEARHPLPAEPGQPPHQIYDGGVREITPLQAAADLDADHVYMILASTLNVPEVGPVQGIFAVVMRTIEIFLNEIARNDVRVQLEVNRLAEMGRAIEQALPSSRSPDDAVLQHARAMQDRPLFGRRPVSLTMIQPRRDPFESSLDFDPIKIEQAIAHGYEIAREFVP